MNIDWENLRAIAIGFGCIIVFWLVALTYFSYGYREEEPEIWEKVKRIYNPKKWFTIRSKQ